MGIPSLCVAVCGRGGELKEKQEERGARFCSRCGYMRVLGAAVGEQPQLRELRSEPPL